MNTITPDFVHKASAPLYDDEENLTAVQIAERFRSVAPLASIPRRVGDGLELPAGQAFYVSLRSVGAALTGHAVDGKLYLDLRTGDTIGEGWEEADPTENAERFLPIPLDHDARKAFEAWRNTDIEPAKDNPSHSVWWWNFCRRVDEMEDQAAFRWLATLGVPIVAWLEPDSAEPIHAVGYSLDTETGGWVAQGSPFMPASAQAAVAG